VQDQEYVFTLHNLINPAPIAVYDKEDPTKIADNRSIGSMDAYAIRVNQLEYNASTATMVSVRDAMTYIGFSNGVKMTVRIMPQLTFKIAGVDAGDNRCGGVTTDITTDAYTVDFGSISNTNFTAAAQQMSVNTNAPHGYVITAIADDQMRLAGMTCPDNGLGYSYCIHGVPHYDTTTDQNVIDTAEDPVTTSKWTSTAGFGYTLHVISGDTYLNDSGNPNVQAAFDYGDDGGHQWRSFADRQDNDDPVQIFNNLRSTAGDVMQVCYQIQSSAGNVPGNYVSTLTYTITA